MAPAATATVKAIKRDIPFAWEGRDKRGARIKGKSLAPDEQTLRAELRRQGVAPSRIRKQRQGRRGGKVNAGDIAVFSRQLATMLAAGIPLVQAFEIVGNGNDKPSMQKLILDVKQDVEGGTSLHEALGKHPLYFDDLFVNLVEAGEQAGALESLLDKVATYKEKTEALKKKVKKALFYPAAVLVVAVIVTVVLLIFVIPQFEALYKGFGADLPAFTQFVIHISQFVQHDGILPRHGAGGAVWAFIYFKKRSQGHARVPRPAGRSKFRSSAPSSTRRQSRATRARSPPCSRPAFRWWRPWIRWPAPPAISSTRTPCGGCATRSRPASGCSARWRTPVCSPTWSTR